MKKAVRLTDGYFEIGLQWRHHPPDFPNNRLLAEVRLQHLKRRLQKDQLLLGKYIHSRRLYKIWICKGG
ncbi:hypothetical protein HOLleu_01345 [Holothuria leucospilota]|uniref:Uncharacterized protein n=1 Tax=Holothuria leucospilota TaxID=206669 RepID=A0A9Q1CQP9_HOLLE|nr:hypothetical protein HOLleu_01345 [Holothuria leucospilota]